MHRYKDIMATYKQHGFVVEAKAHELCQALSLRDDATARKGIEAERPKRPPRGDPHISHEPEGPSIQSIQGLWFQKPSLDRSP